MAYPKTKITFERGEISDCRWDSGKYAEVADGDWENCVRSQGTSFEGDWGVIVLCTMFLLCCIFFNKCLFFIVHDWILSFLLKQNSHVIWICIVSTVQYLEFEMQTACRRAMEVFSKLHHFVKRHVLRYISLYICISLYLCISQKYVLNTESLKSSDYTVKCEKPPGTCRHWVLNCLPFKSLSSSL